MEYGEIEVFHSINTMLHKSRQGLDCREGIDKMVVLVQKKSDLRSGHTIRRVYIVESSATTKSTDTRNVSSN